MNIMHMWELRLAVIIVYLKIDSVLLRY